MSSLVTTPRPLRRRACAALSLGAGLALALIPATIRAQVTLTHTEDAAPVPTGVLRLRVTTGWSRIDERFTATGRRSLSDEIATDSLGPRQLPLLQPVESALQALTSSTSTRLTLGRLGATSGARTVVTPIALEYGLTRRLSVGLLIPIVQTRRAIHVTVNDDTLHPANVSFVPSRLRSSASQANAQVYTAFSRAADSLATLLTRCPANPTASGCATVNANTADASATQLAARRYADAVKSGLGTDTSTALIAPRENSDLAKAIDAQRLATNIRLQKYLGSNAGSGTGVFTSSSTFSYIDLQGRTPTPGLLRSALGGGLDSIQTIDRPGFLRGLSVAAQYLVFDGFRMDTVAPGAFQSRLAVGGALRMGSTPSDSGHKLGTIEPGRGSGFELHSAMDFIRGNLGGTVALGLDVASPRTVDASLYGDPEAYFSVPVFGSVTATPGSIATLDVTPRYLIGDLFAIDGHYGLERTGATTLSPIDAAPACAVCGSLSPVTGIPARTAHRVGFGFRYSTVAAYERGDTGFPAEISFTHLETISGDPGVAKVQRDQIQVRLFFRLRGSR